jgi:hypothetical protein
LRDKSNAKSKCRLSLLTSSFRRVSWPERRGRPRSRSAIISGERRDLFDAKAGKAGLPALDFLRSDILANTGKWRDSDVMDGSELPEPAATLNYRWDGRRQLD